jgi:hypothetical protein
MKFLSLARRLTLLLAAAALMFGVPAAATASAATSGSGWISRR